MRKRRVMKALGVVVLLGLLVSACAGPPEQAPPEENVGVYAYWVGITSIDPTGAYSDEGMILVNAYETLVRYDPTGGEERVSPVLATSWEANEDATEWTFKLREGVKFHDGTEFNAQAVKYSVERNIERGLGASYVWASVEQIEVLDDQTVRFSLSEPAPLDLYAAAHYNAYIISPTCDQAHDTAWYDEGNDCGSGPYVVESREYGQRCVMTRFDDYWGGWKEGQFDRIIIEEIEDPSVRQQRLEAGTIDVTLGLPYDNLEALDARDDITVYSNPAFLTLIGLYNHRRSPLDNKLVRQALSYAFPYEAYISQTLFGYGVQSRGVLPATMLGHGDGLFQYSHDLDKAEDLLAEAGYPEGGLDLVLVHVTGDLLEQQGAELWKAELSKLGVNLTIQPKTGSAMWEHACADPEHAQDIMLLYCWPDTACPYSFLSLMWHCEDEPLWNLGYVCNPEVDALMDEGVSVLGSAPQRAETLFIEAQEILVDNADSLFVTDLDNIHVLRSDIKGYVDNPAYQHSVFWYDLTRE